MSELIAMWSGPRNLSTAMMRSFEARKDTAVWDEPFFASYLAVSGKDHPGREETLLRHETDPVKVAKACLEAAPDNKAYYFQKHMPHHMLADFSLEWTQKAKHFFLIRDPQRVIASYVKGRAAFDVDDLGYRQQKQFYSTLSKVSEQNIPILDYMDVLRCPESTLKALCDALNIPWSDTMLSWAKGPRDTDGAWAPYWYNSVERSTGFAPPPNHSPTLANTYLPILQAVQADYDELYSMRLTV